MIPKFSTYLKESVWGNISKRAEGTQKRKEEEINQMNIEDFYDYLHSRYKCKNNNDIQLSPCSGAPSETSYMIYVYMFDCGYVLCYNGATIETQYFTLDYLNCKKDAQTRYRIKMTKNVYGTALAEIYPLNKTKEVSNEFFLDVLDYLLSCVRYPMTKNLEIVL